MAPISHIVIKDTSGNQKAVLTADGRDGDDNGFLYLTWKKRVNGVNIAEFGLNADNPEAAHVIDKYEVEIWRRDTAISLAAYKSFEGEIRDDIRYTDKQNRARIRIRAYGPNSMLARREILWPPNVANRTVFSAVAAETVMKNIVIYNCVPASITTGVGLRDRMPNTLGITVPATASAGNSISWKCGGRSNVLIELQKIARIAGGDFALVKTGTGAYQFNFYAGQLGTDRTSGASAVVFSTERGNMANPSLARLRSEEKTVAIIGGSGEENARVIRTRTGANFSATNDIEMFIDGRNADTNAYLDATGDEALAAAKFRNVLEFDILQAPLFSVEKDYFLGDKVKAIYADVTTTQQVLEIAFEYTEAREAVSVVMKEM